MGSVRKSLRMYAERCATNADFSTFYATVSVRFVRKLQSWYVTVPVKRGTTLQGKCATVRALRGTTRRKQSATERVYLGITSPLKCIKTLLSLESVPLKD